MKRSCSVSIPKNIEVKIKNNEIIIDGPIGSLSKKFHDSIDFKIKENEIFFSSNQKKSDLKKQIGTIRSLIRSMIFGVQFGFFKNLKIVGVGYRVSLEERFLSLSLGFSNTIRYKVPNSILVFCPNQNEISLKGVDKQLVGQVAAEIRSFRKPELYKGKGIRYENEIVKLKESKKK
ncbi:50S ribosomal protein L6 [Candidatus Riesia pediculicola]|uniref:50S ribosomal protein L6 n=1 Tax=Candidatus Riesia pediculicola TaxID=401619 RepID=UPI0009C29485|nr:50S ribosomal protein L6 [Candidatus Riesia pediculicola]ARC54337.1 hypothetical protein AOE57_01940 [Candidatus Riesia pediculicola]